MDTLLNQRGAGCTDCKILMMDTQKASGILYLCATPIGNLEDITLRVLRLLKEVDLIAAENKTRTQKLLNYFQVKTRLTSYREDNKESRGNFLIQVLQSGKSVALVSDGGMPGISDPGRHLVNLCHDHDIHVRCAPGPSAVLTSLVLSGFNAARFVCEGFLPRKKAKREDYFSSFLKEQRTIIFFEAPHRLLKTLREIEPFTGDRKICILRELTKTYEEALWGSAEEHIALLSQRSVKGEITLVIEGSLKEREKNTAPPEELPPMMHLQALIDRGVGLSTAAKEVSLRFGLSRREVYKEGLGLPKKKTKKPETPEDI
jgi:16S rRNA (cytidine1402-2'-O)-methyltransferase